MRSFSNPDGLTLADSPGCFWFLGGFFCVIGGAAIIAAISSGIQEHSLGQTLIAAALGMAAIGAGIYIIYNAPASRVVISRTRNLLTVSHRGLLRRQEQSYSLSSIQCVYLLESEDTDGNPVYKISMRVADGQELPRSHLWLHNSAQLEISLAHLSTYMPRGETRKAGGKRFLDS
jgi:hypothetical protein